MKKHNRRYKDSVFVDLFGEDKTAKENFLSLYNALHDTHLDCSTRITPLRLDHVMYMSFCNDVSCLIDNKIIVLAEHQSTVNSNMPSQTPYVHVPCLWRVFALQKHRIQCV